MPITGNFDLILTVVLCGIALIYIARLAAGGLLYLAGSIPGRTGQACRIASAYVTPLLARRLAASLFSAATVGGIVATGAVNAAPLDRGPVTTTGRVVSAVPALDRGVAIGHERTQLSEVSGPVSRPPVSRPPAPGRTSPSQVRVRPGDCLWNIAAAHLPAGSTAMEIDQEWRRWYRTNRDLIGTNPDLLRVGVELRVPA